MAPRRKRNVIPDINFGQNRTGQDRSGQAVPDPVLVVAPIPGKQGLRCRDAREVGVPFFVVVVAVVVVVLRRARGCVCVCVNVCVYVHVCALTCVRVR